ncbi:MAG TPA: CorA family divalent cation transporter [Candidatus Andersenbacteria bacterium]|nr:CorA family divalent cation transporter [Candidatus Andersenbacteria bacterium]
MKHELNSKDLHWLAVQSPTPEELAEFVRSAQVEPADAEFLASPRHRPEVTVRPDYILIMVSIPVFDRAVRITTGASLFFVVRSRQVLSLHYDPIVALDRIRQSFVESSARQEEYFADGPLTLALHITHSLYDGAWRKLERLAKHIDIAEDAVFQGNERKMVEEISVLTRDVMDFRKIIRPQRHLLSHLPRHELVTPPIAALWRRVGAAPEKIWETLEGMLESVKELAKTNFTLLQYKENQLLRMLTIYSIVIIPIWIFVAPFDPFHGEGRRLDAVAFWSVLSLLVVLLLFILLHLRRRRVL